MNDTPTQLLLYLLVWETTSYSTLFWENNHCKCVITYIQLIVKYSQSKKLYFDGIIIIKKVFNTIMVS